MVKKGEPSRAPWSSFLRAVGHFLLGLPRPVPFLLALAWMVLIWALSAQSFPTRGEGNLAWGTLANLAHAPLFGFLGLFLAAGVLRAPASGGWPAWSWGMALGVLSTVGVYGLVDEWHQGSVPGRDPSGLDVVTDVVGCASVLWIIAYLGQAQGSEAGLVRRLLVALALCVLVAWFGAWVG